MDLDAVEPVPFSDEFRRIRISPRKRERITTSSDPVQPEFKRLRHAPTFSARPSSPASPQCFPLTKPSTSLSTSSLAFGSTLESEASSSRSGFGSPSSRTLSTHRTKAVTSSPFAPKRFQNRPSSTITSTSTSNSTFSTASPSSPSLFPTSSSLRNQKGTNFSSFAPSGPFPSSRSCSPNTPTHGQRMDRTGQNESSLPSIRVKLISGSSVVVPLYSSDSVSDLKNTIFSKTGIPSSSQRLIFKGRAMADTYSLGHYRIENGNVVHLVFALSGGY